MSLCARAKVILDAHPAVYMTAVEVAIEADGHAPTHDEAARWELALLSLVDGAVAFPRQPPREARSFRARSGAPAI